MEYDVFETIPLLDFSKFPCHQTDIEQRESNKLSYWPQALWIVEFVISKLYGVEYEIKINPKISERGWNHKTIWGSWDGNHY